jgi:hypothetical protein
MALRATVNNHARALSTEQNRSPWQWPQEQVLEQVVGIGRVAQPADHPARFALVPLPGVEQARASGGASGVSGSLAGAVAGRREPG